MKKAIIFVLIVCVCISVPTFSFTEDRASVDLAKTLYTLAGDQSDETIMALGTVIMNRVESPWYPSSLEGVINQQHAFPRGSRYDARCLKAAHELISGERTLPGEIIAYQAKDATAPRPGSIRYEYGMYNFFDTDHR